MALPVIPAAIGAALRATAVAEGVAVLGEELSGIAKSLGLGDDTTEITIPVSSSAIRSITYHIAGIITVDFVKGGSYDYVADETTFMAFVTAPSKGAFFNAHFK